MGAIKRLCVCTSGKAFNLCCEPFLLAKKHAKTPVQLMRSRFSAFALGGHGQYLFNTWGENYRSGLDANDLSLRSTDWLSLDIIAKSQQGDNGVVEFKAHYCNAEGAQETHHERSLFKRQGGRWFYTTGDVF